MSVIAGLVHFDGKPVHVSDLEPAAQRLAAIGLAEPTYWLEGPAGLLVRQRFITSEDLAEQQPWIGAGGKWVLVYDGRLDNREELAAALGMSLAAEIVPDGRLLLAALERWGEAALPRLIGDFALALWDKEARQLLLARDPMGRRTLYYHQGAGFVAFATTFPGLLALPGVPRQIDELGMADFLILNMRTAAVETFYQGVRRVPPAAVAVFGQAGLRTSHYWSPEPRTEIRFKKDEEYAEAAREQLDRAVGCRLRAKDGVAAALSGGLDSSAVATSAALQLAPGRLTTITSVPPEGLKLPPQRIYWYPDERPYVSAIAAMHGNIDPVLASSTEPHWIERQPEAFFELAGMPARGVSNTGWLLPGYERLQQLGIQAYLTGEIGNAGWSYDGLRRFNALLRQGRWPTFARELYLAGKRRPYGRNWLELLRKEVLKPLEPPVLAKWRKRIKSGEAELWSGFSAINPAFAREIDLSERCRQQGIHAGLVAPADGLKMRLYMLSMTGHGQDIQTALRTFTGIEHRVPLADVRLLEFCLSLPEEQFLHDGEFRSLPRRALEGRLPQAVLRNNLIGSQNPELTLRMAAMRQQFAAEIELLRKVPLAARMVDLDRLAAIVRRWNNETEIAFMLPRAIHVARFLRWTARVL